LSVDTHTIQQRIKQHLLLYDQSPTISVMISNHLDFFFLLFDSFHFPFFSRRINFLLRSKIFQRGFWKYHSYLKWFVPCLSTLIPTLRLSLQT
jgi:hypothetical protein